MWEEFLKIPKNRVGVLIGTDGKTKKKLEEELKCKFDVSSEGDVGISSEDSLMLLKAKNIAKAIGRGFNPNDALDLLDDDFTLHIINLEEELGERQKVVTRLKARIIGSEGMAKRRIEQMSRTKISIYGKTVSIIGKFDDVEVANEAISMLLDGMMHKAVFNFLEKKMSSR